MHYSSISFPYHLLGWQFCSIGWFMGQDSSPAAIQDFSNKGLQKFQNSSHIQHISGGFCTPFTYWSFVIFHSNSPPPPQVLDEILNTPLCCIIYVYIKFLNDSANTTWKINVVTPIPRSAASIKPLKTFRNMWSFPWETADRWTHRTCPCHPAAVPSLLSLMTHQ